MYLKRVYFEDYGPLKKAEIIPRFNESGKPVPIALVGVNGAGKTLVLSSILDALVTMRRTAYSEEPDVDAGKLFKPLTHSIRSNNTSHFALAVSEFATEENVITFSEAVSSSKEDSKFNSPEGFEAPPGFDVGRFERLGIGKALSKIKPSDEEEVRKTVTAYFPAGRAELPGWLGPNVKINFDINLKYNDISRYSIWRINLVNEITQWILDIVLDAQLYDVETQTLDYKGKTRTAFLPVMGRNRRILTHLNQLLSDIIQNHSEDYVSARFAIAERSHGNRSVRIQAERPDGTEVVIANQLQDLSTGELMAFCLFADIIRMAEMQGWDRNNIDEIKGVVLVDEIDIHLHIRLQKEVLPSLIKKFPSVQFIFSTHSPFLALGVSSGEIDIINMPTGTPIDVAEFSEFGVAYDTFFEQNDNFRAQLDALTEKLAGLSKVSVVTEGKTDWKHLRHALSKFQGGGDFTGLDIEFYETPNDMGDSELKKLFRSLEKIPPTFPVVCLFDRDRKDIVKEFTSAEGGFIVSNNVAGTCLAVP
ncbi:MAG: AAA family ATPase, partial [Cognatishimia sp.]|uniref:AAA family ATPase n=1 Tax=Cognatishimia sp. TaxID=2211648 RepID=UPI0040594C39